MARREAVRGHEREADSRARRARVRWWWAMASRRRRTGAVATVAASVVVAAVFASAAWSPWWWAGNAERALVSARPPGVSAISDAPRTGAPHTADQLNATIGGQPAPGTVAKGTTPSSVVTPAPAATAAPAPSGAGGTGGETVGTTTISVPSITLGNGPGNTGGVGGPVLVTEPAVPTSPATGGTAGTGALVPIGPTDLVPVSPSAAGGGAKATPSPALTGGTIPVLVAPTTPAGTYEPGAPGALVPTAPVDVTLAGTVASGPGATPAGPFPAADAPTTRPGTNVLDADTATLEGSLGQWQPWFATSVLSTDTDAHGGSRSLRVAITAPFGWGVEMHNYPGYNAQAGQYRVGFWGKSLSGPGLSATLTVRWSDVFGTTLDTDQATLSLSDTWAQATTVVDAPAGTAFMEVELSNHAGGPGEVLLIDDVLVTPT